VGQRPTKRKQKNQNPKKNLCMKNRPYRISLLNVFALVAALLLVVACGGPGASVKQSVTAQKQPILDDPYIWLEEIQGEKALAWVEEQNQKTFAVLKADPRYEEVRDGSEAILNASDRIPHGGIRNGFVYNFWRDDKAVRGLWRRIPLKDYVAKSDAWDVLLDVDKLATDENENWVFSGADCLPPAFERCLVTLSRGGKDAAVIREFDLKTRTFVADGFVTPEAKVDAAWVDEQTLLIGSGYDPSALTDSGYSRQLRVWKRGEPIEKARKVFEIGQQDMGAWQMVDHTRSSAAETPPLMLMMRVIDFYTSQLWVLDADLQNSWQLPTPEFAETVGVFEGRLLLLLRKPWTTASATIKAGTLVAVDLAPYLTKPAQGIAFPEPKPVILVEPDERSAILSVQVSRAEVLVSVLRDVKPQVLRLKRDASTDQWAATQMPLPSDAGVASLVGVSAFEDDFFLSYEDMLQPETQYLWRPSVGELTALRSIPARFDATGLKVEQKWATSSDGTKIPYFLAYRADMPLDGEQPTLLYGYGGFEVSRLPNYGALTGKYWLERGGVYALANIRGGGEYGPRWHQAALKENRQLAFDDFQAIAQDLIDQKITKPEKLAIWGGSNGGLLMGVSFTQRPDLFGAVICQVPLLDMMRYHTLLAGASWMAEYGNPDVPAEREYILAYSPYQRVYSDIQYPKVFFMTSTLDDRVHPGHARKMAARMIEQKHPILYFENTEGGHGGVANNKQQAEATALRFVFLMQQFGVK
jgi:prolyl oligopeptidase